MLPLSEADTCRKYVVPKLQVAGWDEDPHSIAEQRSITDRRIVPVGNPHWPPPVAYDGDRHRQDRRGVPNLLEALERPLEPDKRVSVNLDIKNPRGKEDVAHLPPEQLVERILEKERRIAEIVGRIKALLEKPS